MKALLQQAVLVFFVVAAGGIGSLVLGWRAWRQGTLDLDEYIEVAEKPEGISNNRYRKRVRRVRRRRRLVRTIVWSVAGGVLGVAAVFAYALYRKR